MNITAATECRGARLERGKGKKDSAAASLVDSARIHLPLEQSKDCWTIVACEGVSGGIKGGERARRRRSRAVASVCPLRPLPFSRVAELCAQPAPAPSCALARTTLSLRHSRSLVPLIRRATLAPFPRPLSRTLERTRESHDPSTPP